MKPTQITELLANIRKTFVSFFSILMFVALGVGIFVGITWSGPALQTAADSVFVEGNFHHFQVTFPYGLTESDIDELAKVEGVDDIEAGRQSFQKLDKDGTSYSVKVQSIGERIDVPLVKEGKLPTKEGEIAWLATNAESMGLAVGDKVTFVHDPADASTDVLATADATTGDAAEGEEPKPDDGMTYLNGDTYTITALVSSPEYVARSSDTFGFSTSGSGSVDTVAWVAPSAFDAAAFRDGYPVVSVRSESLVDKDTFSKEYAEASREIADRITAAGEGLANTRFHSLHDEAESKIKDGETQLNDAKKQVADGWAQVNEAKQKIADGEVLIADGEARLAEGYQKIAEGEALFNDKQNEYNNKVAQLQDGHNKLAQAKAVYEELKQKYKQACDQVAAARAAYNDFKAEYDKQYALYQKGKITEEEFWATIQPAYQAFKSVYDGVQGVIDALNDAIEAAKAEYPDIEFIQNLPTLPSLPKLPGKIGTHVFDDLIAQLNDALAQADAALAEAENATITVDGVTLTLKEAGELQEIGAAKIKEAEKVLAGYDKQAADARNLLNDAQAKLDDARAQAAAGEQQLADARWQLEEAKRLVAENTPKLEDGEKQIAEKEQQLQDAKDQLGMMKEYTWTVSGRSYNGGVVEASTLSGVTDRLSLSMAGLFLIVGLLVSYSAVSRIVREQIAQIGTKKALGLRKREITTSFLAYAGLAVILGAIVGILVGVFVVEIIIGHALGARFIMGDYAPYFGWELALIATAIELVLVLGATWMACRTILRKQAIELLRGEEPPAGKTRFFEKWAAWEKLPLYTQTIVNNCLNDKKRVFSTIVGVAGCTALVVTAVTLNNDVLASYDRQYENVYGFDAIAYTDASVEGSLDATEKALQDEGATTAQVLRQRQAIKLPDGDLGVVTVIVPKNLEGFEQLYKVKSVSGGECNLADNGVWMTQAYSTHYGAQPGDTIVLNGSDGAEYQVPIAGFREFYLTYHELVMSPAAYKQVFGKDMEPNVVLANTEGASEGLADRLASVEGFRELVDDKTNEYGVFNAFSSVSGTVVLIYLALSVLMAIVVLLNLNVMFIEEKKRELIVLMINGFSVKDAKKYIYNDTIVLTTLGILVGLVLGAIMGAVSVASLEPSTAWFVKDVDGMALLAGILVSTVLAFIMSLIALQRIPRFKLTDINKV